MLVRTKGKPKRHNVKHFKEATCIFGQILLSSRLYPLIEVKLKFESGMKDHAFCEWEDSNYRGREFTITLDKNLSFKNMLYAIAHEMVHVKQYATGEMRDFSDGVRTRFRKKVYNTEKIDYWDYEWEIEANGRERGLVHKYLKIMRERNEVKA